MKMMIWKELRENLKWAVLAMIGLGLAEIYGLNYYDRNNYQDQGTTSLCKATFLMATTFGCALTGMFLGFLQILPEQRRDQWAALIHRPVTRGVILRGKVVAGILLYLLATVPPFLVCIWLVATPGHFTSPFAIGTILPGVADNCAGLVYYFAALFMALQRGSWFGARVLGLLAAVHLSFFITRDSIAFHVAVEAAVLMGLGLFTAGWGAILSNGLFRVRPWLGRLAMVAIVFYGLCGLGELAELLSAVGQRNEYEAQAQYRMTNDGTPLVWKRNADLTETVTDLAGHVIDDARYKGQQSYDNFLYMGRISSDIGESQGPDFAKLYPRYRNIGNYISAIQFNDGEPHPVLWFYLSKSQYYQGISALNKMPVRMVDHDGFKPWGSVLSPFQREKYGNSTIYGIPCLMNEGTVVHVIDLPHEEEFQLPNPDGAKIFDAARIEVRTSPGMQDELDLVLVTQKELRIFDAKGDPIAVLPYHYDVSQFGQIDFTMNAAHDRFFVDYSRSQSLNMISYGQSPSHYEIVDGKGEVIKSYVLSPFPEIPVVESWTDWVNKGTQSPFFWFGTVAYQKVGVAVGILGEDQRLYNKYLLMRWHKRNEAIQILAFSLLCVPVALIMARRARLSRRQTWAWAILVFAFNIGGLLTFWLVTDWPVKVKCPQCSRKRPVEEEMCPHCRAMWPGEKASGIEIFEERELVAERLN